MKRFRQAHPYLSLIPGAMKDTADAVDKKAREQVLERTVQFRCDRKMRKRVTDVVTDNFSAFEIMTFDDKGKPSIRPKTFKGQGEKKGDYGRKSLDDKNELFKAEIELRKNASEYTIIHEFVHHSRVVDWRRRGYSKTAYPTDEKGIFHDHEDSSLDMNKVMLAEEAATVAETAMRCRKGQKDYPYTYYDHLETQTKKRIAAHPEKRDKILSEFDVDSTEDFGRETYRKDRKMLRTSAHAKYGEPVVGMKAFRAVEENFENTKISKIETGGESAKSIFGRILKLRNLGKYDRDDD
jgi:hypothetical protein